MEHDDLIHNQPRRDASIHEEELDARLRALFRSVEPPEPSAGFTDRTMKAVMRDPLPEGRRRLRHPMADLIGWAAMIAGVAVSGWAVAGNAAMFAAALTALLKTSLGAGVWVVQFADSGVAMSDVFVTVGNAMSRVLATREGTTGLVAIAAIGALSLSALHRLLESEGRERGVSQWPEF